MIQIYLNIILTKLQKHNITIQTEHIDITYNLLSSHIQFFTYLEYISYKLKYTKQYFRL